MIVEDKQVKNVIKKYKNENHPSWDMLYEANIILCEEYSFVDNQTYPRPTHPLPEKRVEAYFTLVAIILSLRTTLENEQKAVNLFIKKYKSINEVINADIKELTETIKCAGMPNKKAETIIKISQYIKDNLDGDIKNLLKDNIELTREEILKLPGVGEKSADCLLKLGFNFPSAVVDTNVFRVISRLYDLEWSQNLNFSNPKQVKATKYFLDEIIPKDIDLYQIVHTLILLHGKHICKAKPKCSKCKISHLCSYYKKHNRN